MSNIFLVPDQQQQHSHTHSLPPSLTRYLTDTNTHSHTHSLIHSLTTLRTNFALRVLLAAAAAAAATASTRTTTTMLTATIASTCTHCRNINRYGDTTGDDQDCDSIATPPHPLIVAATTFAATIATCY